MGTLKNYRSTGSYIPTSILRQNLPNVLLKNYPNREASVRERYSKSYLKTLISCVQVKQTALFSVMSYLKESFGDPPPPLVIML
jgi:hypothetical protein